MTTVLEASTQAWLKSRNISTTSSALDQARDSALTALKGALGRGDPIDPQAVAFLMDYYNDSTDGVAAFRAILYEGTSPLMDHYVVTQKGPMTDALTPLLMSAQFAPSPDKRNQTVAAALANGRLMGQQPSVQSLAMLATLPTFPNPAGPSPVDVTGKEAAVWNAEQFIKHAAANGLAVPLDLLNTYIAFNPMAATAFLDSTLSNYWKTAHSSLLDAYRQLNPMGASTPAGGVASEPGDLNPGFDANPPSIKGWSWFAMNLLLQDNEHGRPVNEALLRQLGQINPTAAAYAAWGRLEDQLLKGNGLDALSLEVLSAVKPELAKSIALRRLEGSFGVPITLLDTSDGKIAADHDNLTTDTTPTFRIDLMALGKEVKVGDKLLTLLDSNPMPERVLTAEDITRGWVDVTSGDLSLFQGAHIIKAQVKDGATNALTEFSPGRVFTLDSKAPTVSKSSFESQIGGFNLFMGVWIQFDSADELASVSLSSPVTIYAASNQYTHYLNPADTIIDHKNKRIYLKTGALDPSVAAQVTKIKVPVVATDMAGNKATLDIEVVNRGIDTASYVNQGPSAAPSTAAPPPRRMLDHAALTALQALDPGAAEKWRSFYTYADLMGTPPPAPAPVPGTGAGTGKTPPLTADELLNLDLETLVYRVFMGRFDALDELLKEQLAYVQKINEDMAKLNTLLGAINGLVERVPSDTDPSKKMSEIFTGTNSEAGDATKITAALAQIPGLKLFSETEATGGGYDRTVITKGGLLSVQQNLKAKLDSMSNQQQHETLRTQMMNSKRLECLTLISNLLEAANSTKKEILRKL